MKVFVFDLDFTIWNAGDTFCSETNPPYFWEKGKLIDQTGRWIRLYPEVLDIFEILKSKGIIIAVASRTNEPAWAMQLVKIFNIEKYFQIKEIYSGCKITHLKKIQEQVGCSIDEIIFFDDEEQNIKDAQSLGILCTLVTNGINMKQVEYFI